MRSVVHETTWRGRDPNPDHIPAAGQRCPARQRG